ncbi:Protein of unknown function [Pyronema omphalodes CBS 100304]|uniref:Uncharacterized protein n=1 Tax=Pyronema omphalodes (strain CBS 100304) TaxID=1076935 RepID=U4LQ00_PYROM|nr:Protein of unknown function [Pyronema omphalodes CBS 100304]
MPCAELRHVRGWDGMTGPAPRDPPPKLHQIHQPPRHATRYSLQTQGNTSERVRGFAALVPRVRDSVLSHISVILSSRDRDLRIHAVRRYTKTQIQMPSVPEPQPRVKGPT